MVWNLSHILWALMGALGLTVLATALAWPTSARRRRQHESLVRDAVARMCAQRSGRRTGLLRLGGDVVDILARQDKLINDPDDAVLLVSADTVTTTQSLARENAPSDDTVWRDLTSVPRVADHPELADLCDRTRRTIELRINRAQLVLDHAARLGKDEDCRNRLSVAFDRAANEVRAAAERASTGDMLGALRTLTHIDLPVPDEGVPGRADVRELRAGVNALARLALRHREAIAAYKENA